ncbi:hypothetical protein EVAR_93051_1 [Eumeta japonica]|uniref:Uncharacterized protein n=1 Tax=Eumeta variegata TaxID=151549 RepID=A0A4C1TI17_EUMVA|nr:hypothetical protein EVAR_93051_1 [Eumeta japonica]
MQLPQTNVGSEQMQIKTTSRSLPAQVANPNRNKSSGNAGANMELLALRPGRVIQHGRGLNDGKSRVKAARDKTGAEVRSRSTGFRHGNKSVCSRCGRAPGRLGPAADRWVISACCPRKAALMPANGISAVPAAAIYWT